MSSLVTDGLKVAAHQESWGDFGINVFTGTVLGAAAGGVGQVLGGAFSGAAKAGIDDLAGGFGRGAVKAISEMTPKGFAEGTRDLGNFVSGSARNIRLEVREEGLGKAAKAWGTDVARGAISANGITQAATQGFAPMVIGDKFNIPDALSGGLLTGFE